MTAQIVELPKSIVQDIPRVLRAIADEVEAGEYGTLTACAIVVEDEIGNVRTFGAGLADYYRGIALFHLAIENLMAKRGREFML